MDDYFGMFKVLIKNCDKISLVFWFIAYAVFAIYKTMDIGWKPGLIIFLVAGYLCILLTYLSYSAERFGSMIRASVSNSLHINAIALFVLFVIQRNLP